MSQNTSIWAADIERIDIVAEDLIQALYQSLMSVDGENDTVIVFEGTTPFVMAEPMSRQEANSEERLHVDPTYFVDENGELVDRLTGFDIDAEVNLA